MDEFIDELLREDRACDVILPRIQVRWGHCSFECNYSTCTIQDKILRPPPFLWELLYPHG